MTFWKRKNYRDILEKKKTSVIFRGWGGGRVYYRGTRILWSVGTVLYLRFGGYMTVRVHQNSQNNTPKKVHLLYVNYFLIMKTMKALRAGY